MTNKGTKEKMDAASSDSLDDFRVPHFLQHGRKNPTNGADCFFSETTFRKLVGPEPSFCDKLMLQIQKAEENVAKKAAGRKKKHKDFDVPSQGQMGKNVEKTSVCSKVKSNNNIILPDAQTTKNSGDVLTRVEATVYSPKGQAAMYVEKPTVTWTKTAKTIVSFEDKITNSVNGQIEDGAKLNISQVETDVAESSDEDDGGLVIADYEGMEEGDKDEGMVTTSKSGNSTENVEDGVEEDITSTEDVSGNGIIVDAGRTSDKERKNVIDINVNQGLSKCEYSDVKHETNPTHLSHTSTLAETTDQNFEQKPVEVSSLRSRPSYIVGHTYPYTVGLSAKAGATNASAPDSGKDETQKQPLGVQQLQTKHSKSCIKSALLNEKAKDSHCLLSLNDSESSRHESVLQTGHALTTESSRHESVLQTGHASTTESSRHESVLQTGHVSTTESSRHESVLQTSHTSTNKLPLIPALVSGHVDTVTAVKPRPSMETLLNRVSVATLFYNNEDRSEVQQIHAKLKSETMDKTINLAPEVRDSEDRHGQAGKTEEGTDIPIFSIAGSSPDAGAKKFGKNRGVWKMDGQNQQDGAVKPDSSGEMKFRVSDLTKAEMSKYLHLYGKYVRPYLYGARRPLLTQKQQEEMADFEVLQRRVLKEQQEFQAYLQQNAINNPKFYEILHFKAKKYATGKAQNFRPHPKIFALFTPGFAAKIPLMSQFKHCSFTFQQVLLEMGAPPKILLPDLKSGNEPVPIPCDMKKLGDHFPMFQKNRTPDFIHHECVGQDVNADALAIKYNAKAVLSSSVIKCLMNNRGPGYTQNWSIPVTVKEHKLEDSVHKVVYLNKPVFEKRIMREYNALYHKYAFRVMVSHPTQKQNAMKAVGGKMAWKKKTDQSADDPFDLFDADLDSVETFGKIPDKDLPSKNLSTKSPDITGSPSVRKSNRIAKATVEKSQEDSTLSGPSVEAGAAESSSGGSISEPAESAASKHDCVTPKPSPNLRSGLRKRALQQSTSEIDTVNESTHTSHVSSPSSAKKATTATNPSIESLITSKGKATSQSASSLTKSQVVSPEVNSFSGSKSTSKPKGPTLPKFSFQETSQPTPSNSLLDLILGPEVGNTNKQPRSKENPNEYKPQYQDMSSLVYNLWMLGDNKVITRTRTHGTYKNHNVYMTTKMEYQSNHGLEQVTAEERVRDWAACYFRPGTRLLRARVNAFNGQILMYEELDTHQILKTASDFRPEEGFAFVNDLLNYLLSLDGGQYMISHERGTDFCGVRMHKHNTKAQFAQLTREPDADQRPDKDATPKSNIPWNPIDVSLMLPFHQHHERVPATFMPKDVPLPQRQKKPPQKDNKALEYMYKQRQKKKNGNRRKNQQHGMDIF